MMEFGFKVFVLGILFLNIAKASGVRSESNAANPSPNEDADLTTSQLITKYGYHGESHVVTTADGYILELHRITGPNNNKSAEGKQPILMVHAFLSSSVDWVIIGPQRALAYLLADAGYDVWMANLRGNLFSRRHVKYSHFDKEFWKFSWHENGIYDLPAMIDYILEKTGRDELVYLGYSMGTTSFWVMASERPEYQQKVKAMFALAPVAYCTHIKSIFYQLFSKFAFSIETVLSLLGQDEFEPSGPILKAVTAIGCDDKSWTQPLCANVMSLIGGFGSDQLNTTMLPVLLAHVPAGGATRQFIHYLQVIKNRKFQQYDHGFFGNFEKYNQFHPPSYNLSKIKVPVFLHYASNDEMADPMDVDRLYKELGNAVSKIRVPHEKFGHLDFPWAKDGKELLYNTLIGLIEQFRT